MNLDVNDQITITGLPTQAPTSTRELFVEGWSEQIGVDGWTVEYFTSPRLPAAAGQGTGATPSVLLVTDSEDAFTALNAGNVIGL